MPQNPPKLCQEPTRPYGSLVGVRRRKAIEKFEVEVTDFVRNFLRAKYAEKFPSSESLYEYSIQIVKDKILQPEITSYSKVIEQGGSWMEFRLNRDIEENVKMYLVQKM